MSILTTNLNHLYQCRNIWPVYMFLGFITFMYIMMFKDLPAEHEEVGMGIYFIIWGILLAGQILSSAQIEILNKPFTYCLPGHRKNARQILIPIGICISIFCSLLIFLFSCRNYEQGSKIILSAFFAFITIYYLIVWLSFISIRGNNIAQSFWSTFLIIMIIFQPGKIIWDLLINYSAIFIFSGIISIILVWKQLGNDSIARRFCGKPFIGFTEAWNREKVQKYKRARISEKRQTNLIFKPSSVEQFFLGRMMLCKTLSTGRYVWGSMYTKLGMFLSPRIELVGGVSIAILIVLSFICFTIKEAGYCAAIMLFTLPCFMIVGLTMPAYSSMLVAGGRKERFISSLVYVFAVTAGITIFCLLFAALTYPMAKIMPEIVLKGATFTFHPVEIKLFFIPLMMLPFVGTLSIIFYRRPMLIVLSIVLIFLLYMMVLIIPVTISTFTILTTDLSTSSSTPSPTNPSDQFNRLNEMLLNPANIIALTALSWIVFTCVLYFICSRRPLVVQGR
jgi:hypothetical protein